MSITEVLFERWQVTEYKDGCVYKTKKLCEEWRDMKLHTSTDVVDEDNLFWVATCRKRCVKNGVIIWEL